MKDQIEIEFNETIQDDNQEEQRPLYSSIFQRNTRNLQKTRSKKLTINFFKCIDLLNNDTHEYAQKIFYLWEFAKIETKIPFEKFAKTIHQYISNKSRSGFIKPIRVCRYLKQYYIFEKLPDIYFNLPKPKLQLFAPTQELNNELKSHFFCRPKNTEALTSKITWCLIFKRKIYLSNNRIRSSKAIYRRNTRKIQNPSTIAKRILRFQLYKQRGFTSEPKQLKNLQ
ncbi:20006_t:CDS:2, partial [Gigaspora rosea]